MNDKELQQAFLQFLAQKSGAKTQKELEQYVQSLGEEGLKQAYQEFTQIMQQQAQKAAHGAKLQYFKRLKNQCNEDEELVYYKKGGMVECGCQKKETGGTFDNKPKKSSSKAVNDFKNRPTNNIKWNDKLEKELKYLSNKGKLTPQEQQRLKQLRNQFKNSSNTKDYELEEGKKGMKIEKDCGGAVTKFKAKCGTKIKKRQPGGKVKVTSSSYTDVDKVASGEGSNNPRIQRVIQHTEPTMKNDTTYYRALHSQYGNNKLSYSSSNKYGSRKKYKEDEKAFNHAKAWGK